MGIICNVKQPLISDYVAAHAAAGTPLHGIASITWDTHYYTPRANEWNPPRSTRPITNPTKSDRMCNSDLGKFSSAAHFGGQNLESLAPTKKGQHAFVVSAIVNILRSQASKSVSAANRLCIHRGPMPVAHNLPSPDTN